ncbi:hypothetical protein KP509_11G031200 [Ceratopteris richardii]|uniref:Uncharacterized protein n=1 Tax=Ceratopteris richardii TaxID=49495 RepID=A0A8T2TQ94_CERRI|nr:hypothetical protein KP509_11G031200 [Ceratopteris richardii]
MAFKIETKLKPGAILQQMQQHSTRSQSDGGKEVLAKSGFIYQFVITPKKLGKDDEMFAVDLKNRKVYQGAYDGKHDDVDDEFIALYLLGSYICRWLLLEVK